jgi:hypothetical protein
VPTPGGLLKAGDKLIHEGDVFTVIERTSSTAPYSVWIRQENGQRILGFRSANLRNGGTEARLSLETGQLPGRWKLYDPIKVKSNYANDIEFLAKEMFPEAYEAIDDDHPMPEEMVRAVQIEQARRSKNCVVVAVKQHMIASATLVETFGPFTHEEADAFALALSDRIKAEWMFYSHGLNSPQDVDADKATLYLLDL